MFEQDYKKSITKIEQYCGKPSIMHHTYLDSIRSFLSLKLAEEEGFEPSLP